MEEHKEKELQEEFQEKAEQVKQMATELQDKAIESLNKAMVNTAESLDKTADTIHKTADFFRKKNADNIKEDMSNFIKKHPGKALTGALIFGFLFGKTISR